MARLFSRVVHVSWAWFALSIAPAHAEPPARLPTGPTALDGTAGRRLAIDTPIAFYATPYAQVSPIIFLDRCRPNCVVTQGNNDARSNSSSIPKQAVSTLTEFRNTVQIGGEAADAEWAAVVQCVKEVYSPYNVTVTDVLPGGGQPFHRAIVGGIPIEIGYGEDGEDILGVAPLSNDCSAIDNVISFTFANAHVASAAAAQERILNICWTTAQESAHAFGLDHQYTFPDGKLTPAHSACNDPMTYRMDCGGQKFFRNEIATCGETSSRACKCGANQNSHLKINAVFGPGTPITGAPTITLTDPLAGAMLNRGVSATASSKRGVSRVELFFNGFKWAETQGVQFGARGQPAPSPYTVVVPADLPNSIVDIKMVAYDDLGASTESAVVTVTRGAPCDNASTCANGQKCEAGKCFWDPPVGEIGDDCSFAQFCKSGICTGTSDQQICTQSCIPNVADSCPSGLECVMSSANAGLCFFAASGGCCSVDGSHRAWWVQLALAAVVLGYVSRRRRR